LANNKPPLYAPSTNNFWDDEHISKGLLKAHLDPDRDAATRRHEFADQSVCWIAAIAPPSKYRSLLDLGCGPGLYAERFNSVGYAVTGVDFSKHSIEYATEQAVLNKSDIEYHCQDYLTIDYAEQFHVVTLIYCDYAVLAAAERRLLLQKVHRALKPNGKFIFDVFTPRMRKRERRSLQYCEDGGFWSKEPHICVETVYQYDDDDETELTQYIVFTDETVQCYNIWNHYITKDKLLDGLQAAGFREMELYGDVAGKEYSAEGDTICCVCTK
jgi:SAM-dependent methyltransferase